MKKNWISRLACFLILLISTLMIAIADEDNDEEPPSPFMWETEAVISVTGRVLSPKGNQDYVREYDRERVPPGDMSEFALTAHGKGNLVRLKIQDIFSPSWQDMSMDWTTQNLSFSYDSTGLYHRVGRFNQNWIVNDNLLIAPENTTTSTGTMNVRDNDPDDSYFLKRRENHAKIRAGRYDQPHLVLDLWSERDHGNFQLWTKDLTVSDFEHPQTARTWFVDRTTTNIEAGFEGPVAKWPISYRYLTSDFSDNTSYLSLGNAWSSSVASSGLGGRGQGFLMFPSFSSTGHRVAFATPFSQKTGGSASYTIKTRENRVSNYQSTLSTLNINGFWRPHPDWSFTGSYYIHDRSTDINSSWVAPDASDLSLGSFDYDNKRYEAEVHYNGWKWGSISAGYQGENTHRSNEELIQDLANAFTLMNTTYQISPLDPNSFATRSSRNTWYANLSARPNDQWNFRTRYSSTNANHDDFTRGTPGNNTRWSADLSFTPTSDQLYFVNYNTKENKAELYSYKDKNSSFLAGCWLNLNKWGLGATYALEDQDTSSWIYWAGWRPKTSPFGGGATVHMFTPEYTTYTARNKTWMLNAAVPVTKTVTFDSSFLTSQSRGVQPLRVFNNLQNFGGSYVNAGFNGGGFTNIVSEVNTVDVTLYQLNIGADIKASDTTKIRFDLFAGKWHDKIDPSLNGSYTSLWVTGQQKL